MTYTVSFPVQNKTVSVAPGTLVSDAARTAGVADLHLPCGGRGTCGRCSVLIAKTGKNGSQEKSGLACATRIDCDLTVIVEPKAAAGKSCIVAHAADEVERLARTPLSPLCRKLLVRTKAAGIEDNNADLQLLQAELSKKIEGGTFRCRRHVLRTMAAALREKEGLVTVTLFSEKNLHEIIAIEAGDTERSLYGIACDIGTTTVSVRLVDMASGKIVSTESEYNGQLSRGADVISRIEYGRSEARLEELRQLALGTVNTLVHKACAAAAVESGAVAAASLAGNSVMTHLFLGLQPRWLREHPYVPTVKLVPPLTAAETGLAINPAAPVIFAPGVGSYVGGDITAGLLCTGMIRSAGGLSLFIDIGTNGEIVIGNREFLLTAACSAGPAFEGSGISCGMRAADGAIDSFEIEKNGASVDWSVIGGGRPGGICGSGLISALGELLRAGVIDRSGKFTDAALPERRAPAGFVLVNSADTAHGRPIVIAEADIDNLIRTKAAIFAACDLMLASAGLDFSKVDAVLVAGGFGRFIDVEDAVRIGLFPPLDRPRFSYLGNTSLAGATLALLSQEHRDELKNLPGRMTYVELSNDPRYMNAYTAALFLPHTDLKRFGMD